MARLLIALVAFAAAAGAAPAAEMKFYQLPSGSYPHDVAPAADGTVWFSGQSQGIAGRFDPQSGKVEKIPLGAGAAPHGVIVGPDGNAWFTEGGQNAIARVDVATREVKLYPLPAAFARANLNTSSGSPVKTASMAASIPRAARSMPGRHRAAAVPTALR
jgi:virginiamycin B lyase